VKGEMTSTVAEGRAPKSDLEIKYDNGDGEKALYISHKDGKSANSFQQWGGVSAGAAGGIRESEVVKTFVGALDTAAQKKELGLQQPSQARIAKNYGFKIPPGVVYAYDPSISLTPTTTDGEEKQWQRIMLRSLFGPKLQFTDDGKVAKGEEAQPSGKENVDIIIQNRMKLTQVKKGKVPTMKMDPTHVIKRKDIEGKTISEAFKTIFGPTSGYSAYSPVVMAKFDSGREFAPAGGQKGGVSTRVGIYPAQNRNIRWLLAPEDNGYVWLNENDYKGYVKKMKDIDDDERKRYLTRFRWGKNEEDPKK